MEALEFEKVDGTKIQDVDQYVKDWLVKWPHGEVIIGCDSQEHTKRVTYAIVVVMHGFKESAESNPDRTGYGAHVITALIQDTEHRTPKGTLKIDAKGRKTFDVGVLAGKLWKEVELTVQAAALLSIGKKKIKIHIDYSEKEECGSHMLYNSGIGLVKGMGYGAVAKPDAYAASHTADKFCR